LLGNEPVAFKQIDESRFEVVYGPISFGVVDERDKELKLKPRPKAAVGEKQATIAVDAGPC
jgi:hypothetical protein